MALATTVDIEITGTCQTCKHWEMGWKHFEDRPLSPLVTNNAYGKCIMVEYAGIVNEVIGNPATIYFGAGDDIQFITNGLFGCNQWVKDEPVILPDYQE